VTPADSTPFWLWAVAQVGWTAAIIAVAYLLLRGCERFASWLDAREVARRSRIVTHPARDAEVIELAGRR